MWPACLRKRCARPTAVRRGSGPRRTSAGHSLFAGPGSLPARTTLPGCGEVMEAIVDPRVKARLDYRPERPQSSKTTVPRADPLLHHQKPSRSLPLARSDGRGTAKDQSESRLQKLFEELSGGQRPLPEGPAQEAQPHHPLRQRYDPVDTRGAQQNEPATPLHPPGLLAMETWRWRGRSHGPKAEARVTAFGWLGKCVFLSQGGRGE